MHTYGQPGDPPKTELFMYVAIFQSWHSNLKTDIQNTYFNGNTILCLLHYKQAYYSLPIKTNKILATINKTHKLQIKVSLSWCKWFNIHKSRWWCNRLGNHAWNYLLKMPPSTDALRHSGWDRRLLTSSTVTLYFCVELSKESRPGTRQKMSAPWGGWLGSCFSSSGSGVESERRNIKGKGSDRFGLIK